MKKALFCREMDVQIGTLFLYNEVTKKEARFHKLYEKKKQKDKVVNAYGTNL